MALMAYATSFLCVLITDEGCGIDIHILQEGRVAGLIRIQGTLAHFVYHKAISSFLGQDVCYGGYPHGAACCVVTQLPGEMLDDQMAFQVRLCQEEHLVFPAGQHVHRPIVFEQGWRGTVEQKQKQSHRVQGSSFYHVKKEELKVWELGCSHCFFILLQQENSAAHTK